MDPLLRRDCLRDRFADTVRLAEFFSKASELRRQATKVEHSSGIGNGDHGRHFGTLLGRHALQAILRGILVDFVGKENVAAGSRKSHNRRVCARAASEQRPGFVCRLVASIASSRLCGCLVMMMMMMMNAAALPGRCLVASLHRTDVELQIRNPRLSSTACFWLVVSFRR